MSRSSIIKIGLLVVVAIVLMVWGISYLKGKDIFKNTNYYYVVYKKINGLTASSSVMINGFKIGQVTDIRFYQDTSEYLIAELMVEGEYKIREGSVAQIFSQDLMGTKAIRLLNGKDTLFYQDGDTLCGSIEGDLMDQVSMEILPLKKKAESLISSIDSAIIMFRAVFNQNTQENLRKTFASIKITIKNLERSTFTLDTIFTGGKSKLAKIFYNVESITGNLENNNEEVNKILKNFSSISDSLAKADIANTLNKADSALLQFNEILSAINEGDGTLSQLLYNDTLYQNIENATYQLNRLLRDIHENPKRYINFSLLDFGKTIYVEDKEDDLKGENKKKKNKK
ncbi:MAG: MlaD family protein [Bacteroidota bacterium]